MDNSNKIPKVDHGVDVCGDEWDELEEEPKMSSKIEMEKLYDELEWFAKRKIYPLQKTLRM